MALGATIAFTQGRHNLGTRIGITPFRALSFFYAMRPLLPVISFLQGALTDFDFLYAVCSYEMEAMAFFMPWLTIASLRWIWPYKSMAVGFMITILGCISGEILSRLTSSHDWSTPTLSLRGLFMSCYDRWQILSYRRRRTARDIQIDHFGSHPPYQYQPLESDHHIRLLYLSMKPGSRMSHCELIHYDISAAPPYQALSYTWGKSPPSIPFRIDESQLHITKSLDDFLTYQWPSSSSKLFWIDALCINQKDDREKESQIPLMTRIYQRASVVLVWLSPPTRLAGTTAFRAAVLNNALLRDFGYNTTTTNLLALPSEPEVYSPVHLEVALLFRHPWFTRTWIIQELAVAADVHILHRGTRFEWDTVSFLFNTIRYANAGQRARFDRTFWAAHNDDVSPNPDLIEVDIQLALALECLDKLFAFRQSCRQGHKLDLVEVLYGSHDFNCKDPRDKIFALQGLLKKEFAILHPPDYSTPAHELSRSVALSALQSQYWFEYLMLATEQHPLKLSNAEHLPSWVFDLSLSDPNLIKSRASVLALANPKGKDHKRLRGIVSVLSRDVIGMNCSIVGTIVEAGAEWGFPSHAAVRKSLEDSLRYASSDHDANQDPLGGTVFDEMKAWYLSNKAVAYRLHENMRQEAKEGEKEAKEVAVVYADQLFWELVTYNLDSSFQENYSMVKIDLKSSIAQKVFETLYFEPHSMELDPDGLRIAEPAELLGMPVVEVLETAASILAFICRKVLGLWMGSLSTGYLASLPASAAPGDFVVYIRNGPMPIVFRPLQAKGERRDQLVGACNVNRLDDTRLGNDWEEWFIE